uniref:Uncharacterized protein n=1 Tax=Cacopsylla melanoneura TaxID=428564 RepID=A0A8D8ZJ99_9HEMI
MYVYDKNRIKWNIPTYLVYTVQLGLISPIVLVVITIVMRSDVKLRIRLGFEHPPQYDHTELPNFSVLRGFSFYILLGTLGSSHINLGSSLPFYNSCRSFAPNLVKFRKRETYMYSSIYRLIRIGTL